MEMPQRQENNEHASLEQTVLEIVRGCSQQDIKNGGNAVIEKRVRAFTSNELENLVAGITPLVFEPNTPDMYFAVYNIACAVLEEGG